MKGSDKFKISVWLKYHDYKAVREIWGQVCCGYLLVNIGLL